MSHLLQSSLCGATLVLNKLRILELGESDFHHYDNMSEIIKKKKGLFWAHSFKDSMAAWPWQFGSAVPWCLVAGENGRGSLFFPQSLGSKERGRVPTSSSNVYLQLPNFLSVGFTSERIHPLPITLCAEDPGFSTWNIGRHFRPRL